MTVLTAIGRNHNEVTAIHDGIMNTLNITFDDKIDGNSNSIKRSMATVMERVIIQEFLNDYNSYVGINSAEDIDRFSYAGYEPVTFYLVFYFASPFDSFHTMAFIADVKDEVQAIEIKLKHFSS
jgi:hypothetical protein